MQIRLRKTNNLFAFFFSCILKSVKNKEQNTNYVSKECYLDRNCEKDFYYFKGRRAEGKVDFKKVSGYRS